MRGAKDKAPLVNAAVFSAVLGKLLNQIADLDDRLKAFERSPMVYDGPYEGGKAYSKGTFVTQDGSLWHCNQQTSSRPGDGPAWTLAVKRGKDGKDWNSR